jgi:hypothetical protein
MTSPSWQSLELGGMLADSQLSGLLLDTLPGLGPPAGVFGAGQCDDGSAITRRVIHEPVLRLSDGAVAIDARAWGRSHIRGLSVTPNGRTLVWHRARNAVGPQGVASGVHFQIGVTPSGGLHLLSRPRLLVYLSGWHLP